MISAQPMNGSFLNFKLKHTWSLQLVGQSSTCRAPYRTTSPSFIFHLDISFGTCHGHTDKDSMSSSYYQDFSLCSTWIPCLSLVDTFWSIGHTSCVHSVQFAILTGTSMWLCNKSNFGTAERISTFKKRKLLRIWCPIHPEYSQGSGMGIKALKTPKIA